MKLQTDSTNPIKESSTGKSLFYCIFHPVSFKKIFLWLPKSQVKSLSFGFISIPDWLWQKKKDELNI